MALWIVATPIGTLGDMSPRARERVVSAAVVAAEDTRTTAHLLHALDLRAPPMVPLHAHNEAEVAAQLAARALTEEVVLVSDAGTPAISDPGRGLVEACHAAGVRVWSVPGPSALAAALAASGFPAAPSTFLGFPPRKGRPGWAEEVLGRAETLVMYEAGNRTAELVAQLAALAPTRLACMCREISKRHEEILRLPLGDLATNLAARDELRGEVVLVVGPGEALVKAAPEVEDGAGVKQLANALAARWGLRKRDVYEGLLALERSLRG